MCDTLWAPSTGGALFAKNSDRPPAELQFVSVASRRAAGAMLRTQYLEIADTGSSATLLSRPDWLWGAEHGVNEHRVAIGNERVATVDDPRAASDALIGMDLVRLGLERGRNADEALEVMTGLLETHGQGGVADAVHGEPYWSSFLITDPRSAWVLETSGRTWAARHVQAPVAISNRLTIRNEWTLGSPNLAAGSDFDAWRDPVRPTAHADRRLGASRTFLADGSAGDPRRMVAHLRDHGSGPWGAPGANDGQIDPPPGDVKEDATGISVCLHIPGYMTTTSSMVSALSNDPGRPLRAWIAVGSPCSSVFLPVFPADLGSSGSIAPLLSDRTFALQSRRLRELAEESPGQHRAIRAVLDPIESELWDEADAIAGEPAAWHGALARWSLRVRGAVGSLVDSHRRR